MRQEFPEEFDLFRLFEDTVRRGRNIVVGDRWDILEHEEIEFNERDIQYIGESVDKLQGELDNKIKQFMKNIFEAEE